MLSADVGELLWAQPAARRGLILRKKFSETSTESIFYRCNVVWAETECWWA